MSLTDIATRSIQIADFDGNGQVDIMCNGPNGFKVLMNPGKIYL